MNIIPKILALLMVVSLTSTAPINAQSNAETLAPINTPSNAETLAPINTPSDAETLAPINTSSNAETLAPINAQSNAETLAPINAQSNAETLTPNNTQSDSETLTPNNTQSDSETLTPNNTQSDSETPSTTTVTPDKKEPRDKRDPIRLFVVDKARLPIDAQTGFGIAAVNHQCIPNCSSFVLDPQLSFFYGFKFATESYSERPIDLIMRWTVSGQVNVRSTDETVPKRDSDVVIGSLTFLTAARLWIDDRLWIQPGLNWSFLWRFHRYNDFITNLGIGVHAAIGYEVWRKISLIQGSNIPYDRRPSLHLELAANASLFKSDFDSFKNIVQSTLALNVLFQY